MGSVTEQRSATVWVGIAVGAARLGVAVRDPLREHAVPGAATRVEATPSALGERAEPVGALALAGSPPPPAHAGVAGAATTRRREG
ncbi:MAG: hypothetical protein IRZ32_10325 [Solirubrobacteraceae bacterium]|nr:hypothetical protein [Solirubrobacteraceae bacterium]